MMEKKKDRYSQKKPTELTGDLIPLSNLSLIEKCAE